MNLEIKEAVATTCQTLVGYTTNTFPMKSGNCFSVKCSDGSGHRIVNFCIENLQELLNREILEYPIKIGVLREGIAVIHDERIPDEWYDKRFCEVCCPSDLLPVPQRLQHLRDIASGDRKETVLDNGMTIISQTIKPGKHKIDPKYLGEMSMDDGMICINCIPVDNEDPK